jgi:integrase
MLEARVGLGPAEARALRWSRVDLEAQTIRVDAQMNRRNQIVKAKTRRALRAIRIGDRSVESLAHWRHEQVA